MIMVSTNRCRCQRNGCHNRYRRYILKTWGLKRGIAFGAAMPVMLDFASPVPGDTYIGLLVSPLGAVVGGIYGVSTTVPDQEVEYAEAMLTTATDNLRRMRLREKFVDQVIDTGNAWTTIEFAALPQATASPSGEGSSPIPDLALAANYARLEISVLEESIK